jgi:hypothetical protein
MKHEEVTRPLGLENKHFRIKRMGVPVVDSSLYTTFGRRLFEFYKKYEVSPEDQREFERLSFLLMSFTLDREPELGFWVRLLRFVGLRRSS